MSIVSFYPHIRETKNGESISLHQIFENMRAGHWKEKIEPLRAAINAGVSEDEISKLKSNLPYFTASGSFSERKDKGLIQHSGKLAIDFDKIKDQESAREALINDKYSEYVFLSCTGRGYCVIVNIDPAKHLESFLFLERYYKECYGLIIDKACKDLSRPRFISHDDNLFYNNDYEVVTPPPTFSNGTTIDSDDEKYEWVKRVFDKDNSYTVGDRHDYLLRMCFFLNKAGVSESYVYDRYMSDYPDKDEKEKQRIVKACFSNTLDHGKFVITKKISDLPPEFSEHIKNVYKYAHDLNESGKYWRQEDIDFNCKQYLLSMQIVENIFKTVFEKNKDFFNIDNKPDICKAELFIKKRYEILKNEVSQRLECRRAGTEDKFDKLNTDTINRDIMHAANIKFSLDKLVSLLRSDFVPVYNPIQTYFDSLDEWQPDEMDYIDALADHIKTDNQEFWKTQFKKALVRCIACSLHYRENRIIITLVGQAQETGKSNFIRFLCPEKLREYYTEAAMMGDKDSDMQLSENFLWNLEELAALYSKEINQLKAIISKSMVKQRRAYGAHHESNPRRVNFWASTNKTEFLTDDQNTRWLCFNVLGIDHDYNNFKTGVRKINIDNVWAQAYSLYKAGFDFNLTAAEAAQRDLINKEYELSSTEKELIIQHYKAGEGNTGIFVTNTDILIHLQNATGNKIKLWPASISKAMRQLGFADKWKKINGKNTRGYWVTQVSAVNSVSDMQIEFFEEKAQGDNIKPL